jgi:hypothetical protein
MTVTGACLCGAIRFEASVPPRRVTHCHCDMCRRATGAAVGTFATFESDKVRWLREPARYDSSERGWRGFCPTCGSMGIFDEPNAFAAGFHDHREEKLAWLEVDEELPDARGSTQG